MAKGSDNTFPSVLIVEGTTPASPSAGEQRAFIDSADHHFKRVNASGTVTDIEVAASGAVVLDSGTLGINKPNIDITPISGSYHNIRLMLYGRGDAALADVGVNLTVNGDTAANYDFHAMFAVTGGSPAANGTSNVGQAHIGIGNISAASAPTGAAGCITVSIPGYAGTTFHKTLTATQGDRWGASSMSVQVTFGNWRSTAAITRITLTPNSGNFLAGTSYVLVGE